MLGTNGQSGPGTNPAKPERPPVNKKSKTTASDTEDPQSPHFPAVRRLSPSPSFNSSSSAFTPSPSAATSPVGRTTSSDAFNFNFSDRDYVFPSNLGPYSTRRNVTVKSSLSKSQKQQSSSQLPVRSASMPHSLNSGAVDSSGKFVSPANKTKLRVDKDLKALSLQGSSASGLVTASLSVARDSANSSSSVGRTCSSRISWKMYLLMFFCIVSASYAIFMRNEVTRLQEEYTNLHRLRTHKNAVGSNIIEVLEIENGSSPMYLVNSEHRAVALYTVIITLITPFLLFKYFDYLPRIKNLSKRTNDNKEEIPLKKRIAYMVDVCFSVYPYAKLLALLFATMFLIGFGALALYAVSDGSFTEALWLSWTFVADSGNHADRVLFQMLFQKRWTHCVRARVKSLKVTIFSFLDGVTNWAHF